MAERRMFAKTIIDSDLWELSPFRIYVLYHYNNHEKGCYHSGVYHRSDFVVI